MSDDVYSDLGLITTPAAADRVPLGTGPGAGGYSPREEFAWQTAPGSYRITGAEMPMLQLLRSGVGAWTIGYSGTPGDNNFALRYNGGAPTITVNGTSLGIGVAPAAGLHVKLSSEIMRLESTTVRGSGACYQTFRDPTGAKAFFGYAGSDDTFYLINNLNTGMIFATNGTNRWQIAANGPLLPMADAVYNFADPSLRIANSFFSVSPTVTSDEREKKWRGAPTKAELKAATRIIGELGFYQWNDAIAEKGDEARYHFGARAQRVWAIMAEEKLVAPIGKSGKPGRTPYAFLCFDEWKADKDTGLEAGNRYGVRTDQLIMFLMAAQQEQIVDQEARLRALEAAL